MLNNYRTCNMQRFYLPSARELSRLCGVCKAPIIQHFAETISGTSTIRSFDQESRFHAANMKLTDGYSRPKFNIAAAMEWLCIRLDMLSSITFVFSLMFLISIPPRIINPGAYFKSSIVYPLKVTLLV